MKHKPTLVQIILILLAIAAGGCNLAKHEKKALEDTDTGRLERPNPALGVRELDRAFTKRLDAPRTDRLCV